MGKSDSALIKELKRYAKAKHPIDAKLLKKIPYFADIFPDRKLWSVLVRLSKKDFITQEDGIAYIEHKNYQEGEKIITKGQSDQIIYWILSGHAHIVTEIKDHSKTIDEVEEGECIGEQTVLRGAIRTADVVAGEGGVSTLQIDWSIIEKSMELGKDLYQLVALHLADKLSKAYESQVNIISSSVKVLRNNITDLITKNRNLEKLLKKNNIDIECESDIQIDRDKCLGHVIANIKESLNLLETYKTRDDHDILGILLGASKRL